MVGGAICSPFYSNIYHPLQTGNVYSNSTNKEKLERLVIKIRKIIFRTHKMNTLLEIEQKNKISQVEKNLIKI